MKHSKLPWKVITWGQGSTRIVDANDDLLYGDIDNAPFICEACNNYEALQVRVKELEEALKRYTDDELVLIDSFNKSGPLLSK